MRNYPEYFATKEDYENIIRDFPEWRERVKEELKALKAIKDDKVTRAVALVNPEEPEGEWITEELNNPLPISKQKGFKIKKELDDIVKWVIEETKAEEETEVVKEGEKFK